MTKKVTKTKKPATKTKVKKAKAVSSAVYLMLDRSGSMSGIWAEALGSINSYVADLKKQKANPEITFAAFDHNGKLDFHIVRKCKANDWADVGSEVEPRGMTPLYDAIGEMTNLAFAENHKRAVLLIMTDGFENASKELDRVKAMALVDKCKAKGWEVVFMGANFDAVTQSAQVNVQYSKTLNVAPGFFASGMNTMSGQTVAYATRGVAMGFSDSDRIKAGRAQDIRTKS